MQYFIPATVLFHSCSILSIPLLLDSSSSNTLLSDSDSSVPISSLLFSCAFHLLQVSHHCLSSLLFCWSKLLVPRGRKSLQYLSTLSHIWKGNVCNYRIQLFSWNLEIYSFCRKWWWWYTSKMMKIFSFLVMYFMYYVNL